MQPRRVLMMTTIAFAFLTSCASAPAAKPAGDAGNTRPPRDVVAEHLRAAEAGDWAAANALLDPGFSMQMKGMPAFATIPAEHALDMHQARKKAFPDFRFNEKIDAEDGSLVRIAVYLSGTHTGPLDYPIAEVPKVAATGKTIALPVEYFTYFVEHDRIVRVFGEIPEGSGPPALKQQLGLPP